MLVCSMYEYLIKKKNWLGRPVPNYPPLTFKLKFNIATVKNKPFTRFSCLFISTRLTNIQLKKYMVLSMLSQYSSCNIHLTLKSFVGLIHIRLVPCTILDLTARYNICDGVNLDEFAITQGSGTWTLVSLKGALASGGVQTALYTCCYGKHCVLLTPHPNYKLYINGTWSRTLDVPLENKSF